MKYRKLGNTGLLLSEISFGASSLGGVFHAIDEKEGVRAVLSAVEQGINFIDVSPYYGHCKAETVLGKALSQIPRDRYHLATKVGRYGRDGVNLWDYSAARSVQSVYESMERLGVDYIDLIQVHDIEFQADLPGGLQKVVDETLPALWELKEKGVVGHVGITDLQPENLKWVVEHAPQGSVETVLNFCHYCLNDDLLQEYFNLFEQRGIGIINAAPFAMGLLTRTGVPAWHPAPPSLIDACRQAADYCESQGYPIEKLAIQFAVSNPRITTTLFSTANPLEVTQNLAAAQSPLDTQLLADVRRLLAPAFRLRGKNT